MTQMSGMVRLGRREVSRPHSPTVPHDEDFMPDTPSPPPQIHIQVRNAQFLVNKQLFICLNDCIYLTFVYFAVFVLFCFYFFCSFISVFILFFIFCVYFSNDYCYLNHSFKSFCVLILVLSFFLL